MSMSISISISISIRISIGITMGRKNIAKGCSAGVIGEEGGSLWRGKTEPRDVQEVSLRLLGLPGGALARRARGTISLARNANNP